jgi:predicted hydrocarbon binding protein
MNLPNPDSYPALQDIQKVVIEGVKEIIGPVEARELFTRVKPGAGSRGAGFPSLEEIHRLLIKRYGERGGQGVALRAGRAAFKFGLRTWGGEAGFTGMSYRLQPFNRRVCIGLEQMASVLGKQVGTPTTVSEDAACWYMQVESCAVGEPQPGSDPSCFLLIGMLQEFMTWAGGGKAFQVRETACHKAGAPACTFQIDKKPLE